MREKALLYIKESYSAQPEFLWAANLNNAAIRNKRTGKWFAALIGKLPKHRLGIDSCEEVDVLNLKCDPLFAFTIVDNRRIFRGYHMNKEHWISVLLDGSVSFDELKFLIDMSYAIVDKRSAKKGGNNFGEKNYEG